MTSPGAEAMSLADAYVLCHDTVRADDHERWVASLYWPAAARPHIHALLAFNVEIGKVPGAVRQPTFGEIRFQWWRDAVENDEAAGNPVAHAFLDTVHRFNLDRRAIQAFIEARSFDLYDDPMPSEAALENYLRDTSAFLFDAVARVLASGLLPPPSVDAAGRALGLVNLLRGFPWQIMKGQLYIPLDLLERLKLPPESIFAHRNSPGLGLVMQTLRARVRTHLREMAVALERTKAKGSAGPADAACLPAFLCEPYLRRMEKPSFNPFDTVAELPPWQVQWTLWRAARRL